MCQVCGHDLRLSCQMLWFIERECKQPFCEPVRGPAPNLKDRAGSTRGD
jgi:hypothetical protein